MTNKKCKHTPCPIGYIQWHSWAKDKMKTHDQEQCKSCGLWAVWVKKI